MADKKVLIWRICTICKLPFCNCMFVWRCQLWKCHQLLAIVGHIHPHFHAANPILQHLIFARLQCIRPTISHLRCMHAWYAQSVQVVKGEADWCWQKLAVWNELLFHQLMNSWVPFWNNKLSPKISPKYQRAQKWLPLADSRVLQIHPTIEEYSVVWIVHLKNEFYYNCTYLIPCHSHWRHRRRAILSKRCVE